MKIGCQWRELSIKEYFGKEIVSWQTYYYYYYHKCSVDDSFKNALMDAFKALLFRYEKKTETWLALQWLAFIATFIRRLKVLTTSVCEQIQYG